MHVSRNVILLSVSLVLGFWGCSQQQKTEAPKQEQVTKDLVPSRADIKGQAFAVEITDLKVTTTTDIASKEIVGTPNLRGRIKITNGSKDVLDIQAVTLEYLDETGKPIPYQSDEKIDKVNPFWKALQPGDSTEGTLDVTIPRKAVKEKSLGKFEVNLIYVPSPLKRESLILSEKIQ